MIFFVLSPDLVRMYYKNILKVNYYQMCVVALRSLQTFQSSYLIVIITRSPTFSMTQPREHNKGWFYFATTLCFSSSIYLLRLKFPSPLTVSAFNWNSVCVLSVFIKYFINCISFWISPPPPPLPLHCAFVLRNFKQPAVLILDFQ